VLNPGDLTVLVEIFLLELNQPNPSPVRQRCDVAPGATSVLEDVLLETFGLTTAAGAPRVAANCEVAVSSRIFNVQGSVTVGQGVECVPRSAALTSRESTEWPERV
jgi:hypothetical protein